MTASEDSHTIGLADRLRARIKRDGPIPFSVWMEAALYDPVAGYYSRDHKPQGRAGDYRTAPEISPLFGAVFARYFMKSYFDFGAPDEMTIFEVGAGAGDCAHAVLTELQQEFPKVFAATRYIIDELNPAARSQSLSKLGPFKDTIQFRTLGEVEHPIRHGIIFSNELIDAFPVHRVIGRHDTLRELYVGLSDDGNFIWVEAELSSDVAEYCERIKLELRANQIFEINLAADQFVTRAAAAIVDGLVITVDYGADREELLNDPNRFGGTLRGFHRHRFVDDLLAHPGEHDLTTTVDWSQLEAKGAQLGLETLRLERLDQFLLIEGAAEVLGDATGRMADPADFLNFNAAARELLLPTGMASHFQVLVQRKR
jgi:SAM-dependent MidA family methyltransferase